jgi:tetratricopeptide (TPR) repeat protein
MLMTRLCSVVATLLVVQLSMLAGSAAVSADTSAAVTVNEGKLTLSWWTSEPIWKNRPRKSSALWPEPGTQQRAGERTFDTVVLENEYLRVQVIPEIGGAVAGATYKPTGEEIFFREGRAKDWLPFWESGVKVAFPWREHCVRMEDQAASWRIVRHDDGSVTLAMWMEFTRHTDPWEATMFGAYTTQMLSQHITLAPGRSDFAITYRLTNPTGFRQGRRIWTDAFFPRYYHDGKPVQADESPDVGPTTVEGILPVPYVAHHLAKDMRPYDPAELVLANSEKEHNAIFGIGQMHGFTGLWYPEVEINRLRISDPSKAPGAKFYWRGDNHRGMDGLAAHMNNFVELWGGADNVMEGVEHWLHPGQTFQFTHRYVMVRDIGKVDFANDDAAINFIETDSERVVEIVPYMQVAKLEAHWNGKSLGASKPAGPERPARFELTGTEGTLKLIADGQVILEQQFPLPMPVDKQLHERIKQVNDLGYVEGMERLNDQMDYGRTMEKAARMYPAGTTAKGRALYRLNRLDAAAETLRQATTNEPADGEAWHLLGLVRLEQGDAAAAYAAFTKALAAARPYQPAHYFVAMHQIGEGELDAARKSLDQLLTAEPNHWEAKLLLAYLDGAAGNDRAKQLVAEDPADPRAVWMLAQTAEAAGDDALRNHARQALDALSKEEGAARRLSEFQAATRGQFKPLLRLQSF